MNQRREVALSARGVSLNFLEDLGKEFGHYNGYDLKKKLVIPSTNASKTSLVEELWFDKPCPVDKAFGDATVFVSHAWRNTFGALVDAISSWESEEKSRQGVYYFLDIFAVNQHKPASDLRCIKTLIANSNTHLLILSPLENPIPLSRAWCLFEIQAAIKYGTNIACALPESEGKQLMNMLLRGNNTESLMNVKLDSRNAVASVPEDAVRIKDDIQKDMGFFLLDQQVYNSVSKLLFQWALQGLDNLRDIDMYGEFFANISRLYGELKDKSRKYDSKICAQVAQRNLEQHINELPPYWTDLKLSLVKRSPKQMYQNALESLGQRGVVSKYFRWHSCFVDTVPRSELLALLEYVFGVELPTTVFKIIYNFLPIRGECAIRDFLEGNCTVDDLFHSFDTDGDGKLNQAEWKYLVSMSFRQFCMMRNSDLLPPTRVEMEPIVNELITQLSSHVKRDHDRKISRCNFEGYGTYLTTEYQKLKAELQIESKKAQL